MGDALITAERSALCDIHDLVGDIKGTAVAHLQSAAGCVSADALPPTTN